MTKTVYDQFDAATGDLGAYALMDKHGMIGRVVVKYARSGMRATAYAQMWGAPMGKGFASGYGYDKTSPAVRKAFEHALKLAKADERQDELAISRLERVLNAIEDGGEGRSWTHSIEGAAAGYTCANITG